MADVITVKYSCGCEATGLRGARNQGGVPNHCGFHGTAGDDMRVVEPEAEKEPNAD